jgi:capsular polysaccharide transport system permease protein
MIDTIKKSAFARWSARAFDWLHSEMAPALLRRRIIGAAVIASLLAAVYWLAIASDRYVSQAHVIIERTDLSGGQTMDFSNLIAGVGNTNRADQLLLRDHLLSVEMLRKLDAVLKLRAHYADPARDPFSRLWSKDEAIEDFHRYYLSRVSVEYDDYAGVLMIEAQAFDPRMAHAITTMLVQEGERFMNQKAHNLARAQVSFLEQQVLQMNTRALAARRAVLDYQNRKGLVSPQATAEAIAAIVARLEAQRIDLQTQRSSLQAYLVADHPNIVMLNQQIAAIEKQLARERARLATPSGASLNRTVEEFQRLEADAVFADDVYKTALVALERGRVEAIRTIKKMSVMEAPTMPEDPVQPRRLYNTLVSVLIALLVAGVAHLLMAIIRDHAD